MDTFKDRKSVQPVLLASAVLWAFLAATAFTDLSETLGFIGSSVSNAGDRMLLGESPGDESGRSFRYLTLGLLGLGAACMVLGLMKSGRGFAASRGFLIAAIWLSGPFLVATLYAIAPR